MNLFSFLDVKYRQTAISLQQEYSVFKDGKAKAAHQLIGIYRNLSRWYHLPALLTEFALVKLGVIAEPLDPMKIEAPPPKEEPTPAVG